MIRQFLLPLFATALVAVDLDPATPVNGQVFGETGRLGAGFAWQKIFWGRFSERDVAQALAANTALKADGRHAFASLMQWSKSFYQQAQAQDQPDHYMRDYLAWVDARPHYWALRQDGSPYASAGWISPMMPLDPNDVPDGASEGWFADWTADRLTDFTQRSGINAFSLADCWNGFPEGHDFNPRIMADFARRYGLQLPEGDVATQSQWILTHHFTAWTDHGCLGWSRFLQRLIDLHRAKTGEALLISFQTAHHGVGADRRLGIDLRLLLQHIPARNLAGRIELQAERGRGLKYVTIAAPKMAAFAARNPDFHTGVQISAPERPHDPIRYDPQEEMSKAIDRRSGVTFADDAEKSEFMAGFTLAHWTGVMWAHCATRDGRIRRAALWWLGNHGNRGTVPQDILDLVLDRVPTAPFGPAFYHAVSLEDAAAQVGDRYEGDWAISTFSDRGLTPVYGISDVALARLEWLPTAFLVWQPASLPHDELAVLTAIAPVLSLDAKLDEVPAGLYVDGATGFAFVDQRGETVIVIARTEAQMAPRTAGPVQLRFRGVQDGDYVLNDLRNSGAQFPFTVREGIATVNVDLPRWGCRIFASNVPTPNRRRPASP